MRILDPEGLWQKWIGFLSFPITSSGRQAASGKKGRFLSIILEDTKLLMAPSEERELMFMGRDLLLLGAFKLLSGSG